VTLVSGRVSAWTNQGSQPNGNLAQATAGQRPTFNAGPAGPFGGRPYFTFAAASSSSLQGAGLFASPIAQPTTVYLVGRIGTVGGSALEFSDGSVHRQIVFAAATTGVVTAYAGALLTSAVTLAAPSVLCAVFNGANSAIYVTDDETPAVSGNAGADTLDAIALGTQFGGAASFLDGEIAEWALFAGAHSATNRARVMQYLRARYAL
jgi:hypothetical protein